MLFETKIDMQEVSKITDRIPLASAVRDAKTRQAIVDRAIEYLGYPVALQELINEHKLEPNAKFELDGYKDSLIVRLEYEQPEDDETDVELIASGYDWTCPYCEWDNHVESAEEKVRCTHCQAEFKIDPILNHVYS
jgi:hypothetical protein